VMRSNSVDSVVEKRLSRFIAKNARDVIEGERRCNRFVQHWVIRSYVGTHSMRTRMNRR
jgi:hypothetical protein